MSYLGTFGSAYEIWRPVSAKPANLDFDGTLSKDFAVNKGCYLTLLLK
ncbi:MAG: hypothetical protein OEZ29_06080 [Candidatus Bathyarchaeota archaeon]|nr:hypothetical protein [Candidatus Bathyarchaeota archaeon]